MKPGIASISLAILLSVLSARSGAAQYRKDIDLSEKGFFAEPEIHAYAWNSVFGGGGAFALEYVNPTVHFGLGARSGFALGAGTDGNWDVRDFTWDNDLYVPIRLTDRLTAYGGAGVTFHDCEYEGLVESESFYRKGGSWKYTYTLKTVHYTHGANAKTSYLVGGFRFRATDTLFFFAEYRRTSGTLEMSTKDLRDSSPYKRLDAYFGGNYFATGVGWMF